MLVLHAAATFALVGLIWFVQVVHYPLFASVGPAHFVDYELRHTRRTTWLVAVLMPLELGSGAWVAFASDGGRHAILAWIGLATVVAIWLMTAAVQAPLHRRLGAGFDEGAHRRLVRSNWWRTALWSARGVLVAALLSL